MLPPDEYQDALRHRLGCQFFPEATTCHCCTRLLDVKCIHAGCCATAEATRGHYVVARTLVPVAKAVDPTTTREDAFGGNQRLRPGDLITGAILDGRRVAVDVGVTSQARRTPGDPIQYYVNYKLNKYRHVIDHDFRNEGISFRADVWAEGRPGRDARKVVDALCKQSENIHSWSHQDNRQASSTARHCCSTSDTDGQHDPCVHTPTHQPPSLALLGHT